MRRKGDVGQIKSLLFTLCLVCYVMGCRLPLMKGSSSLVVVLGDNVEWTRATLNSKLAVSLQYEFGQSRQVRAQVRALTPWR